MREIDRGFAGALEAGEDVKQKGVVAVLGRGHAELKAFELVGGGIEPVAPRFEGERWIGDDEIEGLEAAVLCLEVWAGEDVVLPDFRRRAVVQDHVHHGQRLGGVVHFLPVERKVEPGAALGFVVRLEQERAGAARRIVDGLVGALRAADANHLGHDARNFRRRVELALALARLGGEVAHEVFVGVAEQIVALRAVAAEVETTDCRRWPTRLERRSTISLPLPSLSASLKSATSMTPLEVVRLGELRDDLIHLVADLLVALERDHVGEAAALWHIEQVTSLACGFVGNVLHEQQDQHVILVL